jgi:uncharacterized protein HemX
MTAALALDIAVLLLLAAALGGGLVLNRRVQALRGTREDLARLVAEFDRGLARARQGMDALKAASERASGQLGERIEEARKLTDELAFLAQAADRTADRLAGRPAGRAPPGFAGGPASPAAAAGHSRQSESERALLHALRGVR